MMETCRQNGSWASPSSRTMSRCSQKGRQIQDALTSQIADMPRVKYISPFRMTLARPTNLRSRHRRCSVVCASRHRPRDARMFGQTRSYHPSPNAACTRSHRLRFNPRSPTCPEASERESEIPSARECPDAYVRFRPTQSWLHCRCRVPGPEKTTRSSVPGKRIQWRS